MAMLDTHGPIAGRKADTRRRIRHKHGVNHTDAAIKVLFLEETSQDERLQRRRWLVGTKASAIMDLSMVSITIG